MLELQDVTVYYGNILALSNISLHVEPGETVALIGANGAGKSTIVKAISRQVKVASGNIYFNDTLLNKSNSAEIVKRGIIHVPEGRRIFPQMTVMENIEMGASLRKNNQELSSDFDEIFLLFPRLKERRKQMGGTLSGGEQQMLALARGLIAKPKILILDEPSLGLAPLIINNIVDIIKELQKQGMTILLIEQNANLALQISHRAYVLETGRVISDGDSKEMLQNEHVMKAYLGL